MRPRTPLPTPRRRCVPLQGPRRVSGVSRGSILSFNRRPPPLAAMDQRFIAAAREYVERSNCGDVDACLAMFSNDAVYGSSTVGGHVGLESISAMMRGFFSKFPAVHWEVKAFTISQDFDRSVEFDFVRTGVTDAQGRNTRQVGKEWVCFEVEDGGLKICRIVVETTHTGLVESM